MSDLIKVSEEFHFNGKGLWLGIERTAEPGADHIAEFLKARETLVNSFKAISGQTMTDYHTGEPSIITRGPKPVINLEAERVAILIENAEDEQDLRNIYDKAVEHQLMVEWEEKLKQLS